MIASPLGQKLQDANQALRECPAPSQCTAADREQVQQAVVALQDVEHWLRIHAIAAKPRK